MYLAGSVDPIPAAADSPLRTSHIPPHLDGHRNEACLNSIEKYGNDSAVAYGPPRLGVLILLVLELRITNLVDRNKLLVRYDLPCGG